MNVFEQSKSSAVITVIIIIIALALVSGSGYYFLFKKAHKNNIVSGSLKILSPDNGVYLGAYNFDNGIEEFEKAIGKKVAIGCKNTINDGGTEETLPKFDTAGHEKCYQNGYISTFSIEYSIAPSKFSAQNIINGSLDNEIKQVAQEIKKWGRPIFWLYPREPRLQPNYVGPTGQDQEAQEGQLGYDGGGYGPTGSKRYGEITNNGQNPAEAMIYYGGPNKLDGPERWVDASKHIHDLVEGIAPNQVTWVMGAFTTGDVDNIVKTNAQKLKYHWLYTSYKDYYPGDNYVDWHAIDVHAYIQNSGARQSFSEEIEPAYSDAMKINPKKPLMILEFSAVKKDEDDNRSVWFNDFFQQVKTEYSPVAAILYFQLKGLFSNFRLDSNDPAAKAWQQEMQANANFWLSCVKLANGTKSPPNCEKKVIQTTEGATEEDEIQTGGTEDITSTQCYKNCMKESDGTDAGCRNWCVQNINEEN